MSKRLYKVVAATGALTYINIDQIVRIHETADKTRTKILFSTPDNAVVIKKPVTEVAAEIEKLL